MAAKNGLEIERRWLVGVAPPFSKLFGMGAVSMRIEQLYLTEDPPGTIRRLRHLESNGNHTYLITIKRRISNLVRAEAEEEISATRYSELLAQADPERGMIRKTRYAFVHAGQIFELDVFDAPAGLVILELELRDPEQEVKLPPLAILREVTEEPALTNHELARRVR